MKVTFVGPIGLVMATMSMVGFAWSMIALASFISPLAELDNHALSPVYFGRSLKQQVQK